MIWQPRYSPSTNSIAITNVLKFSGEESLSTDRTSMEWCRGEGWAADMANCQIQGIIHIWAFPPLFYFSSIVVLTIFYCVQILREQVTHWPKEDYGKFYNGDSYILLNTYKEEGSDVSASMLFTVGVADPSLLIFSRS